MAKLTGVKTIDMANGAITAIEYGGAVYAKVVGDSKSGDILRIITDETTDANLGEYFEVVSGGGFYDNEGDKRDANFGFSTRRYDFYRKASEVSKPFAEMVMAKVDAVERKVAAIEAKLAPEDEAMKVGDYGFLINSDHSTLSGFNPGAIVRIIENHWGEDDGDYRVERLPDKKAGYAPKEGGYIRKATDAEVAAAKAPPKPKTGDIVVITANTNGSRNNVGDIGKVDSERSTNGKAVRVNVDGRQHTSNFTRYADMRLATPAEIAKYESAAAQAAKDSVFTKAGRKPNEYRKGDVVRVTVKDASSCEFVGIVEDVAGRSAIGVRNEFEYKGVHFDRGDKAEIVCFAENRADLAKGAC